MSEKRLDKLRVMAEYESSGIWVIEPVGPFRHGMIRHEALDVPSGLSSQFREWIDLYWQRIDEDISSDEDTKKFNQTGRTLAKALKDYLGPNVYVEYIPELPDGSRGSSEIIE